MAHLMAMYATDLTEPTIAAADKFTEIEKENAIKITRSASRRAKGLTATAKGGLGSFRSLLGVDDEGVLDETSIPWAGPRTASYTTVKPPPSTAGPPHAASEPARKHHERCCEVEGEEEDLHARRSCAWLNIGVLAADFFLMQVDRLVGVGSPKSVQGGKALYEDDDAGAPSDNRSCSKMLAPSPAPPSLMTPRLFRWPWQQQAAEPPHNSVA